jgi:hypothetical protein
MTCWGLFSQASVLENNYSYAPVSGWQKRTEPHGQALNQNNVIAECLLPA